MEASADSLFRRSSRIWCKTRRAATGPATGNCHGRATQNMLHGLYRAHKSYASDSVRTLHQVVSVGPICTTVQGPTFPVTFGSCHYNRQITVTGVSSGSSIVLVAFRWLNSRRSVPIVASAARAGSKRAAAARLEHRAGLAVPHVAKLIGIRMSFRASLAWPHVAIRKGNRIVIRFEFLMKRRYGKTN